MPRCSAKNCSSSTHKKERGVALFRFPFYDVQLLKQWVTSLRKGKWTPKNNSRLCSRHFASMYILQGSTGKPYLNRAAQPVPTVFTGDRKPAYKREEDLRYVPNDHTYFKTPSLSCCDEVGVTSDHSYSLTESQGALQNTRVNSEVGSAVDYKRLRLVEERHKGLKSKIGNLLDVIADLENKDLISSSSADIMADSLDEVANDLLHKVQKQQSCCSERLRCFTSTPHGLSPKSSQSPHPRTLSSWQRAGRAFTAPQSQVQEKQQHDKEPLCVLMLDDVAVKKHLLVTQDQFARDLDLVGTSPTEPHDSKVAPHALMLMAVAADHAWKPVAYLLIDSLPGEARAKIVSDCCQKLRSIGVPVLSLDSSHVEVSRSEHSIVLHPHEADLER